jgi:hypothetical protein
MYYKLKRPISVDFSPILNNKSYWEQRVRWVSGVFCTTKARLNNPWQEYQIMILLEICLDKDFKLSYPIPNLRIVKRFGFQYFAGFRHSLRSHSP